MVTTLICTQCGHVGKATSKIRGSLGVEILLWCFFLLPGIIYSVWRRSTAYKICPSCKGTTMIPVDSPRARKILEEQTDPESAKKIIQDEKLAHEEERKKIETKEKSMKRFLVGVIIFMVLGLFVAIFLA